MRLLFWHRCDVLRESVLIVVRHVLGLIVVEEEVLFGGAGGGGEVSEEGEVEARERISGRSH